MFFLLNFGYPANDCLKCLPASTTALTVPTYESKRDGLRTLARSTVLLTLTSFLTRTTRRNLTFTYRYSYIAYPVVQ